MVGLGAAVLVAHQAISAQSRRASDSQQTGKPGVSAPAAPAPAPQARTNTRPVTPVRPVEGDARLNREGGGGGCVAPVSVDIKMPQAKLHMQTQEPAVWYSLVDTIPPVGHTASVSVHPVRLVANGREVGTLESGVVKFREVVRDVNLTGTDAQNVQSLRRLLSEMGTMSTDRLNSLQPLNVTPFVLPPAGVQVMRARLEETYVVDGIGRDTVQLNGWIAVRHGAARPAEGETSVEWGTAVMDTEFVGMNLSGHSKVFGPVHITLDRTKPAEGQVGKIDIPELAKVALLGELRKHDLASR